MAEPVAFRVAAHYPITGRSLSGKRGARHRFAKSWMAARKIPILPIAVIGLFVIFAIFAQQLAPYDPTQISLPQKLKPPFLFAGGDIAHLLGTDTLGRDVLSRLIWGARVSLMISAAVVLASSVIGLLIGLAAGYLGGRMDAFLMRFADGSMAFPGILIALLFAVSLGPGVVTVILALSVLSWASYAGHWCKSARVFAQSRTCRALDHCPPDVFDLSPPERLP